MRGEKDRSSKFLLQHYGALILRGFAGIQRPIRSWRALQPEVVQPKQIPDGLLEVLFEGETVPDRFLVEIATYPEERVSEQVLRGAALMYLEGRRLPEVFTLVLAPQGRAEVSGRHQVQSRLGLTSWDIRWKVVNLWEVPAEGLLQLNDVGLVPWIPLTHFEGEPEPVLRECRRRIDAHPDEHERGNLLAVCQILGRLRYDLPTLRRLFWENRDMIESPFFDEILADPEVINLSRAHLQTLREMTFRILRARFQSLPEDVEKKLQEVRDAARLEGFIESAALCTSLDDFRTRMG